jgi:hypothetical protein
VTGITGLPGVIGSSGPQGLAGVLGTIQLSVGTFMCHMQIGGVQENVN